MTENQYDIPIPESPVFNPKDFAKNLKLAAEKTNKNKRISFRVTEGLYKAVEALAENGGTPISKTMEALTVASIADGALEYTLARYLNSVEKEVKDYCILGEAHLPPHFRRATKALQRFPKAPPLSDEQLQICNEQIKAANDGGTIDRDTAYLSVIEPAFEEADTNDRA